MLYAFDRLCFLTHCVSLFPLFFSIYCFVAAIYANKDVYTSARDNLALASNLAKYSPIKIFFTHRLSNKPFIIWLLTTPPHLKYAAIVPFNLSVMACFADINVSQGSVATCARCGGIFGIHLTANLPRNLQVKKNFLNRLRIDRIMVMSLWPRFLAHPVVMPAIFETFK